MATQIRKTTWECTICKEKFFSQSKSYLGNESLKEVELPDDWIVVDGADVCDRHVKEVRKFISKLEQKYSKMKPRTMKKINQAYKKKQEEKRK